MVKSIDVYGSQKLRSDLDTLVAIIWPSGPLQCEDQFVEGFLFG